MVQLIIIDFNEDKSYVGDRDSLTFVQLLNWVDFLFDFSRYGRLSYRNKIILVLEHCPESSKREGHDLDKCYFDKPGLEAPGTNKYTQEELKRFDALQFLSIYRSIFNTSESNFHYLRYYMLTNNFHTVSVSTEICIVQIYIFFAESRNIRRKEVVEIPDKVLLTNSRR